MTSTTTTRKRRTSGDYIAGINIRTLMAEFWSLDAIQKSVKEHERRNVVPSLTTLRRRNETGRISGRAWTAAGRIHITASDNVNRHSLREVVLHELCHIALPSSARHGRDFRNLLCAAAREAFGVEIRTVEWSDRPGRGCKAYSLDVLIIERMKSKEDTYLLQAIAEANPAPEPAPIPVRVPIPTIVRQGAERAAAAATKSRKRTKTKRAKRATSPEAQARREEFQALTRELADMSDGERDALAAKMPAVFNCEGRPLSPRNTMLVCMQLDAQNGTAATIVGGFRQWLGQGRCVAKGQRGMSILFPRSKPADDGEAGTDGDPAKPAGFSYGTVFDISQTVPADDQGSDGPADEPSEPAPADDKQRDVKPDKPAKPEAPKSTASAALAGRFRTMADGLTDKIAHAVRPLDQNWTHKRGREHASRVNDGEQMRRIQNALRALADAHERDDVPACLENVRTKKRIADLMVTHSRIECDYDKLNGTPMDTGIPATMLRGLIEAAKTGADRAAEEEAKAEQARAEILNGLRTHNVPGFFPTPEGLAARVVELADIDLHHMVLEPSAGIGTLALACPEPGKVTCIEQAPRLCEALEAFGLDATCADTLTWKHPLGGAQFDRVVMNPPFERAADIDHVRAAYVHLRDGGFLVAIMSTGTQSRDNAKSTAFRDWVAENGGHFEDVEPGAFAGADAFRSTGVSVCLLVLPA